MSIIELKRLGVLLLALGCAAGGGANDDRSEPFEPSAEGPPSAPPSAAPTAPSSPVPGMAALPTGNESNNGSEGDPDPTSFDPTSPVPGATPSTPLGPPSSSSTETDSAGDDVSEPPSSAVGALIRGDAPTTASASREGPFDVDTITSGLRNGPDYGTQTLHVPVDAQPPFAGVVVVPGFISPESAIRAWGPFLASHGIVTLTIGTNAGGDPPDVRARALLDGIETLKAEHEREGGPVEGQMALDRFAVMGWSMGGGGTLIAANGNPELRAAIGLAAWSPGVRFSENRVPTLLLAGSADILAGGQSQGFFDSIPDSTPKMLFEVAGGPHDIANDPSSAGGEIGRYGLSWLKVFLEGDERYRQFLLETPSRQSDFRENL